MEFLSRLPSLHQLLQSRFCVWWQVRFIFVFTFYLIHLSTFIPVYISILLVDQHYTLYNNVISICTIYDLQGYNMKYVKYGLKYMKSANRFVFLSQYDSNKVWYSHVKTVLDFWIVCLLYSVFSILYFYINKNWKETG